MMKRLYIVIALLLFTANISFAAIAADAQNAAVNAASSSESFSLVAGTPTLVLVDVVVANSSTVTITAATYNSVAMTLVSGPNTQGTVRTWLYKVESPPSGTRTVEVTFSGSCSNMVGARSYTGTKATNALGSVIAVDSATRTSSWYAVWNYKSAPGHLVHHLIGANNSSGSMVGSLCYGNVPWATTSATAFGTAQDVYPTTDLVRLRCYVGGSNWAYSAIIVDILPPIELTKTAAAPKPASIAHAGEVLDCFGDSFTSGSIPPVSNGEDTYNGYCYAIARDFGMLANNISARGAALDSEAVYQVFPRLVNPDSVAISNMGSSDYLHYTSGLAEDFFSFNALLTGALTWLAIPDVAKIKANSSLITYVGSWSALTKFDFTEQNPAGISTRVATTTSSTTATVTLNGTAIYVWYNHWVAANMGAFTVSVDGTVYSTVSGTGHRASNANQLTASYRPQGIRIGGLPYGSHTVVITPIAPTDGTHFVELLGFGSNGSYSASAGTANMAAGPIVYESNGQRLTAAGYTASSTTEALALKFADVQQQIVRILNADGLRIQWVDSMNAYDPNHATCGAGADGVHPTICGHRRIADAFELEMNASRHVGQWSGGWNNKLGRAPLNLGPAAKPRTAAYIATLADDLVPCDPSAGGVTITLPDARGLLGKPVAVKNVGTANTCTIATQFSQTIDDGTTFALNSVDQTCEFVSNGTNWLVSSCYNQGAPAIITSDIAIANTETQVIGTTILANRMAVGTTFRLSAYGTFTNTTGASTSTYRVRIGSTTLAGNAAASFTSANGTTARTNIPFGVDCLVTIRSVGASGTAIGSCTLDLHNVVQPVLGAGVTATVTVDTTANKIVELTFISGASTTTATFRNAIIDIIRP